MSENTHALDELVDELDKKTKKKTRNWVDVYMLLDRVEKEGMWTSEYKSMTACIKGLAKRLGCSQQYLWRVRKAGRFYQKYEEYEKKERIPVTKPLRELHVGDEILASLDRLSAGDMDRASQYMHQVLEGDLTKNQIKGMLRAAMAVKRASASRDGEQGGGASNHGATMKQYMMEQYVATKVDDLDAVHRSQLVADMVVGVTAKSLLSGDFASGDYDRRTFQVLPDFPFDELTRSTDIPPASSSLLVITNMDSGDPQMVHAYAVDIRTTYEEIRQMRSSRIDEFVDGHCLAVPEEFEQEARECLPQRWSMMVWHKNESGGGEYDDVPRRLDPWPMRNGESRERTLSMALLRLAQQTGWNR